VDFRGGPEDIVGRLREAEGASEPPAPAEAELPSSGKGENRGPGRPKLGVVGREVTLLPRHWEWLSSQPGGASVALRKLVDEARRANATKDRVRKAQDTAFRFMSTMAGNEGGFEEAIRALFSAHETRFDNLLSDWPADVRAYAKRLAAPVFKEQ
jgi:uncharacterized protein